MDTVTYPEYTVTLDAEQLTPGDIFPSHDDLIHTVERVIEWDGGAVMVTVNTGLKTYTVEYGLEDKVQVTA